MNSVGKILKKRREELNKTLSEISNETKISKRYLEALENDNFEEFPGEAYYIGFLRTYALALNLNPEELIEFYKKLKLIEEPIPMEELTKPFKKNYFFNKLDKKYIFISIAIFSFLFLIILVFSIIKSSRKIVSNNVKNNSQIATSNKLNTENESFKNFYKFSDKKIIKELLLSEGITVIYPNSYNLHFLFKEINLEKKEILIHFFEKNIDINLKEGEEVVFSFSKNNNSNDLILRFESFSTTNPQIIYLTIERLSDNLPSPDIISNLAESPNNNVSNEQQPNPVETNSQTNINIEIKTKRNCFIKYFADNNIVKELFLNSNNSLFITANNYVEIHISHLKYTTITINNQTLNLPKTFLGFLVVKYILDQSTNQYKIIYEFKE
jgi:cytoskeletal protein RodZ